jgi:YcaO-like protein with predicted kinase domain
MSHHIPSAGAAPEPLDYAYTHERTQATTGYFACVPPASLSFEAALERLEATPWDDFLHLHLLRLLGEKSPEDLHALAARCTDPATEGCPRPALAALLRECALLLPGLEGLEAALPPTARDAALEATPAVYLRAAAQPDFAAAAAWSALFRANICEHHPLPRWGEADLPPLFAEERLRAVLADMEAQTGELRRLHARLAADSGPAWRRPPVQETFLRAQDALMEAGLVEGREMRHEASLAPIALLRDWRVDVSVRNGAVRHNLRGTARAYGRGLSLAAARASCAMEIVERASAYVSVEEGGAAAGRIADRKAELPLVRARLSELRAQGREALDPNALPLEAPYTDFPLHWLPARDPAGATVLVPAQAVFLFCNLDEPALFLAGGSTGLASGNTLEEAKVAALTEIAERDAEATTPYRRTRCFCLRSRDPRLQALLEDYAACGVRVQFQDLTTELGLPVYQCFVLGPEGTVVRATGANLCGPRAALAALTETPWPYSPLRSAPPRPSGPGLAGLPVRDLEDLPDLSLPSPAAALRLLEERLTAQGRRPLYVELTRADLGLPVVRALAPGLALTAEWERFSRPGPRLFARYLAAAD